GGNRHDVKSCHCHRHLRRQCRSIFWRLSSSTPKNAAPYLQVLSSHLSVTAYCLVFGGDAERMRWCARLSSRKNRSNGGKTVQAQRCSIRYGEPQRSKDQLNDNRASDFRMELRLSVVKEHLRQGTFFLCQLLSLRP